MTDSPITFFNATLRPKFIGLGVIEKNELVNIGFMIATTWRPVLTKPAEKS